MKKEPKPQGRRRDPRCDMGQKRTPRHSRSFLRLDQKGKEESLQRRVSEGLPSGTVDAKTGAPALLCCMHSFRHLFLASLLGSFFIATSRAVTLDWDTVTWTAGSLSNSYDIDAARPGNDVTVTVSGNTTLFRQVNVSPNPMKPAVTPDYLGCLIYCVKSHCLD